MQICLSAKNYHLYSRKKLDIKTGSLPILKPILATHEKQTNDVSVISHQSAYATISTVNNKI